MAVPFPDPENALLSRGTPGGHALKSGTTESPDRSWPWYVVQGNHPIVFDAGGGGCRQAGTGDEGCCLQARRARPLRVEQRSTKCHGVGHHRRVNVRHGNLSNPGQVISGLNTRVFGQLLIKRWHAPEYVGIGPRDTTATHYPKAIREPFERIEGAAIRRADRDDLGRDLGAAPAFGTAGRHRPGRRCAGKCAPRRPEQPRSRVLHQAAGIGGAGPQAAQHGQPQASGYCSDKAKAMMGAGGSDDFRPWPCWPMSLTRRFRQCAW